MALKPGITDMEHDPRLAADYRRASGAMPPADLDERIRAAARREVGAGPRRKSAWQVPLSLAAVVLLSITVVLMMHEEGVDRVEPELPPPAAEAVAPQGASEPAAKQRRAGAPQPSAVPQVSLPASTDALETKPAPASGDAATPMMAKAQPAAEPPAPAAAAALRDEAVPAERNVASAREAARPMLRSAPAGAAADVAAAPAARMASPSVISAPAPGRVLWHDLVNEPAEKWAQRITEWRRAGRAADADLLTAEFRRRFPDQPLPDEPAVK